LITIVGLAWLFNKRLCASKQRVGVILHFEKQSVTIDGLHLHHKYQKSFTEIGVNMRKLYKKMKSKSLQLTQLSSPPHREEGETNVFIKRTSTFQIHVVMIFHLLS
jgi:hypothetical protein